MVKTQTICKKGGQGCFMKKMLIIGLSVFLAGALLFTIALSSQDWNIENISTRPAYTRNDITDDLHETFGFRTDHQIIQKKKMRSIIHKTKDAKTLL